MNRKDIAKKLTELAEKIVEQEATEQYAINGQTLGKELKGQIYSAWMSLLSSQFTGDEYEQKLAEEYGWGEFAQNVKIGIFGAE